MAADQRKHQKKLEKRNAKRKVKHLELAREKSAGLPGRLQLAVRYPILDSVTTPSLWSQGMGSVALSRALPDGSVAMASFLVDRYCLGVKDAYAKILSQADYQAYLRGLREKMGIAVLTPETARHFVESAVAYARSLGFSPHPDYQRAKLIFGDLDPTAATQTLEFGYEGNPLYINGPHEDARRQAQILDTLARHVGPSNAHYILQARHPNEFPQFKQRALEGGLDD